MFGDQVPGDQLAEHAGAAGDQDGAVRVEGDGAGRHVLCQAVHQNRAVADCDAGFVGVHRAEDRADRKRAVVEVHHHESVGVLELRGTDHAPQRRVGEVGRTLVGASGDRAGGDDDQARSGQYILGDPGLGQGKEVVDGRASAFGSGGFRGGEGYVDDVGDQCAVVDCFQQGVEVHIGLSAEAEMVVAQDCGGHRGDVVALPGDPVDAEERIVHGRTRGGGECVVGDGAQCQ